VEVLEDALDGEGDSQDDGGDGRDPSNDIEGERVGVLAHEIFAIHEKQDEDGDNRKPNPVANLGIDENFPERSVGEKNDTSTDHNKKGIEPIEGGGFAEFKIEASFKTHTLTDDVSGGEREDGGGEKRGVEQAEGKGQARPLPCERNESFGGFTRVANVGEAGSVEGSSGANDDEEDDDHAGDATDENIESGLGILARADFFFDETCLEIEELPWSDRGANETREHHEVASVKVAGGDDGHFSGKNPVGMRKQGGKKVAEIEGTEDQKYDLDETIGTFEDQNPDNDSGQWNGNIFIEAKELAGGSDAGKFRNYVKQVDQETGDHDEEGGTQAKFLANEIGETFAGDDAHAGTHLHGDVEGYGHGDEGPEQRVAVGGACLGIGADAAGIVVDVGGDDAGADDGEKKEDAVAPLVGAGETAEDGGTGAVDVGVDGGEGHGRS